MSYSPILIVHGEPNSIFFEIFIKANSHNKIKSPIILISSEKLLKLQKVCMNLILSCYLNNNFFSLLSF